MLWTPPDSRVQVEAEEGVEPGFVSFETYRESKGEVTELERSAREAII